MNQVAQEALSNVRTVKAFANERNEFDRFHAKNLLVYDTAVKLHMLDMFQAFFFGLGLNGINALILYNGAKLHKEGLITVGMISAFLLYMI